MRYVYTVVLLLGLSLLLADSAAAQAQITTAVIQGTVYDATGASIPDATVEIKNLDTNVSRTVMTDSEGRFVALQLQPGRYEMTIRRDGFTTHVQEDVILTVGRTVVMAFTLQVAGAVDRIVVSGTPTIDLVRTEKSSTLSQITVENTPILGRKFEDLLTLTPGVSIVQGPDGDSITFHGQRGIFNNISLDGGDYNNGFFGEQVGGQRAAIDLTLDAIKEFQVVASGATAEFGRTAGGVVNVVTKSGTNDVHGSLFHFQRLEALTANTSDGKPLRDFRREQFGGTVGGPISRDRVFFFAAVEQITGTLTRDNLSVPIGATPCPMSAPTILADEGLINTNEDCQRLALINFMRNTRNQEEGDPIKRPVNSTGLLGKMDWIASPDHNLAFSYNFTQSRKENETFDVPTYGNSANGIEGRAKIQVFNLNFFSTVSPSQLNEFHFTYSRENRPRLAIPSNVPADTAMGFATTFRFGNPFFLQPSIDELFQRYQFKDNYSIVRGAHTIKFGGEWIRSKNAQVFRGFFTGRYIFDSVAGFLRYASPAAPGGFGPSTVACSDGSFVTAPATCAGMATPTGGPLLLYLQGAGLTGPATDAAGFSDVNNDEFGLFVQDSWRIRPGFTLNLGLRWDAQIFPDPVVPPSQTAYGIFLSNPAFPSDGTIPDEKKMFQPRLGFAWDVGNNRKSVLRASWGIYNARQNMLTQVGSITTNGVQQQTIFLNTDIIASGVPGPEWPGVVSPPSMVTPCSDGTTTNPFPCFSGVRVFHNDYRNPRIYTTNVSFEQEIFPEWAFYVDFTHSKGVYLTRFIDFNRLGTFIPFLGEVMVSNSFGQSLYRGATFGIRKRFTRGFLLEANYVASWDYDDDSNERDPFTDRSFDPTNPAADFAFSDRDIRHKFNLYSTADLPWRVQLHLRMQARSAQPITPDVRTATNRNTLRKDNEFFSFDWRVMRPFSFGDRYQLIPIVEMFNTFNNKNLINPLTTPGLFNFDGFLRQGVGDPLQVQLAVRFVF
jgi:hypothetical protein